MTVKIDLSLNAVALTASLVDIRSVSGDETGLADAIERALRTLPHLSVQRDGNAVVARTTLGRAERVILAGHIDTVPVAGNLPSSSDRDRIYGCGSSDMKSGIAVQLRLAALATSPSRDLTYVFYDCEEVEAARNGLLRLSHNFPELLAGDLAILLEPTGGVIEGGCQGSLQADIMARGRRAHSARPWLGHNAIYEAVEVLSLLRGHAGREPDIDGLSYLEALSAVGISGGGPAANVIPDGCTVTVNFRFAPDRTEEQAITFVHEFFPRWDVTVTDVVGGSRPGLGLPAAAALVSATGKPPRAKLGWTDVARFEKLGIPALNYGPGNPDVAHSSEEYVEAAAISQCETVLQTWLS